MLTTTTKKEIRFTRSDTFDKVWPNYIENQYKKLCKNFETYCDLNLGCRYNKYTEQIPLPVVCQCA